MKLRTDQKYTIYCILLEEAKKGFFQNSTINLQYFKNKKKYYGICSIIDFTFNLYDTVIISDASRIQFKNILSIKDLPELVAKKPKRVDIGDFWFKPYDMKPRIKMLEEVILEMEKKLYFEIE